MVFAGIFGLAWWPLLEPVWIYSLHTQVSLYHSFLRTSRKYDLLGQTFQQLSTLRPTRQGLFVVTIIVNKQLYWKSSTSNNVLVKTMYSYKQVYLHWQLFVYITYKPQINHHLFIKAFRKTFWRRETLANIWASLAFQKKFKKLPFWIRLVNWLLNVFKPTKVV